MKAGSGTEGRTIYSDTKFAQLLGAHWWRRQLTGKCDVVAVSPGLIPGTGIGAGSGMNLTLDMADAKPIPEGEHDQPPTSGFHHITLTPLVIGAGNILRAFTRDDFPEDPDRIFLTSWGEWWSTDVIEKSLDKDLQDKFCPSKEEVERQEHIE